MSDRTQRQISGTWFPPALVLSPDYTVGDDRFLVLADSTGRLHAFFSYAALDTSGGPLPEYPYNTILYTYSDDGVVWQPPVDVFIPEQPKPWQGAGIDGVIDGQGTIHLVFSGNSTNGGVLKYASAHVSAASDPHAWHVPSGDWGMAVSQATLIVDQADRLHLIYSARPSNVNYRYSEDHGETWSRDIVVAETDPGISFPDDVALAVDGNGRLHAAWSENQAPEAYPPSGVYHSYSDDEGQSWSTPKEVGGQYMTRVAIATRAPDEVHLVWSSSLQDSGRYASVSDDGGVTWAPAELVMRRDTGLSTYPEQTVVDSNGTIYWIATGEEGDYLMMRPNNGNWSPPIQITVPPSDGWTKTNLTSGTSAVVVGGNELHLIAREGSRPEQAENDRYWHTMLSLDAPALPRQLVPTPTPVVVLATTSVPAALLPKQPGATPISFVGVDVNSGSHATATWGLVLIILPSAALVIFVAGFQIHRKRIRK